MKRPFASLYRALSGTFSLLVLCAALAACGGGTIALEPTLDSPVPASSPPTNPGTVDPSNPQADDGAAGDAANPFLGAHFYLNGDYGKQVIGTLVGRQGSEATLLAKVARQPTAVWMTSIEALGIGSKGDGTRLSLAGHLDAAVAQAKATGKPTVMVVVVYSLPSRDCAAGASAGALQGIAGLATYKTKFIDPIAQLLANPMYAALRVALVIEPDSLPNMVTNKNMGLCAVVNKENLYKDGITYAIRKLAPLPNTHLYLDIGQAGWLGPPANRAAAVPLYAQLVKEATGGNPAMIRGFATNISNYVPVREPQVKAADAALIRGPFYAGNPMVDDVTYSKSLQKEFAAAGLSNMRFIVDTSRNGWPLRNDGQPIDRRPSRGNWCNADGVGLGPRPQASPRVWQGYDAFMWIKPPGESDGPSLPNDASCNPADPKLGAMPGAPAAGVWFATGLLNMAKRATPPL